MTDPELMKTKDYTMIEAAHIEIAQGRQKGCFYDIEAPPQADRVLQNSVKVGQFGQTGYFVAIFDGHGKNGAGIATCVGDKLLDLVKAELVSIPRVNHRSIEEAVTKALKQVSNEVEKQTEFPIHLSGATVCANLIMNNIVYTWQIGDSLAVQYDESDDGKKLIGTELCLRHNLANMGEKVRIFGKGGRIGRLEYEQKDGGENYGLEKVFLPGTNFSLMKTRTLGDRLFHKHCCISNKPEFSKNKCDFGTKYLVFVTDEYLKTDGLTKIMQENRTKNVEDLCKVVIDFCVEQNAKLRNTFSTDQVRDDISVIIVEYGQDTGASLPESKKN